MTMTEQNRAVIVEIRDTYAAALTESGAFVRVRNEGYSLGQPVLLEQTVPGEETAQPRQPRRRRARFTAFASMAAGFLLLLLGGFKGYTTPIGVVSLDVNPSIEYSINCFDRVLDIVAVNDDGETILQGIDEKTLKFRSVDEAVDATIAALRKSGYLTQTTENDVVLSASSYSEQHAEQIAQRLNTRVSKQSDLTVYAVSVSKNEVRSAHTLGTSAGKLHIIEKLGESMAMDTAFNPKDWIETPVREIIAETKENIGKNHANGEKGQSQSKPDTTGDAAKPGGNDTETQPKSGDPGGSTPQQQTGGNTANPGGTQGGGKMP